MVAQVELTPGFNEKAPAGHHIDTGILTCSRTRRVLAIQKCPTGLFANKMQNSQLF